MLQCQHSGVDLMDKLLFPREQNATTPTVVTRNNNLFQKTNMLQSLNIYLFLNNMNEEENE